MTDTPPDPHAELIERMRGFESDHAPDGWPAIRMRDVSALCGALESALTLTDRIEYLKELNTNQCRTIGELQAHLEAVGAGGVSLSMSMFASRKDYDEAVAAQPSPRRWLNEPR